MNHSFIITKRKQFTAVFRYCCPWKPSSNTRSLENLPAGNKRGTWKLHSIKSHHFQL